MPGDDRHFGGAFGAVHGRAQPVRPLRRAMIHRVNLRSLPPAARAVAASLQSTVSAAAEGDAAQLREVAAELAGLDSEQTGTAQGMVTRMLLEEQLPDGLDGDDIRA